MQRGEIWWADLPEPIGSEPGYRRPLLIVQSDDFNRSRIRTVICAVLTTNLKLAMAPGNVLVSGDETKLSKDSVVNVSQIITLDKDFLVERVHALSDHIMQLVDEGLRMVFDL